MPNLKLKAGLFLILVTLVLSCGVKQSSTGEGEVKDTTTQKLNTDTAQVNDSPEVDLAEAKRIVEENRNSLQPVTGDFNEFKTFLKGLDRNSLYSITRAEEYVKQLLPKVAAAYKDSTYLYFLSTFYGIANNQSDSLRKKFPSTIKKLESGKTDESTEDFNNYLGLFGLRLLTTEGEYYLDAKPDYSSGIFSGKVSAALSEYLRLRSRELSEGFSEDAGMLITFNSDYERVLGWEAFLRNYPNSPMTPQAKYYFDTYLATLLTGMDNSRTFDFDGNLTPEVKSLYDSIITTNAKGKSTEIIKGYYDLLRQNNFKFSDDLDDYLKEQGLHSMLGVQPHTR